MRLPSKITSYNESVISKFPPVLTVLQNADTGILALYKATMKHFGSIEEFLDTNSAETALVLIPFGNAVILMRRLRKLR